MTNGTSIEVGSTDFTLVDGYYDTLSDAIQDNVERLIAEVSNRVYKVVKPNNLHGSLDFIEILIQGLDENLKQRFRCSECGSFLRNYGYFVVLDDHLTPVPLLWSIDESVDIGPFRKGVSALYEMIQRAKIDRPVDFRDITIRFPTHDKLGSDKDSNYYPHFNIKRVVNNVVITGGTDIADLETYRRNFEVLRNSFLNYFHKKIDDVPVMLKAIKFIRLNSPMNADTLVFGLERFVKLYMNPINLAYQTGGQAARDTVIAHCANSRNDIINYNGTVMGMVMDGLIEGLSTSLLLNRLKTFTDSLNHMRPTRDARGNDVTAANEYFVENGLIPSLDRRYATLEDIKSEHLLWRPTETEDKTDGSPFDHLLKGPEKKTKERKIEGKLRIPLSEFKALLPEFTSLEITRNNTLGFGSLVTAVYPEAKPIVVWDNDENRNPVSWFVFRARHARDTIHECGSVKAITQLPSQWSGFEKYDGLVFILDKPSAVKSYLNGEYMTSHGLYPEILNKGLYPHRVVMENYSKEKVLFEPDKGEKLPSLFFMSDAYNRGTEFMLVEAVYQGDLIEYTVYTD